MPVENLNRCIKEDVSNPSQESIMDYCKRRDFISTVGDGIDALMYANRSALKDELHKKIDDDVRILKQFFRTKIGATWSEATRSRTRSSMGIRDRDGIVPPWKAMVDVMCQDGAGNYIEWVQGHVRDKAPWQSWKRAGSLPSLYIPVD